MRLFLDANVLFTAAHNPNGKARLVIESAGPRSWSIVSSDYAREEALRNLERKFPDAVSNFNKLIVKFEWATHDPGLQCPENLPDKDRPIFSAARVAKATHLLTGDLRDFGPIMNDPDATFGILVQTVARFLDDLP